MDQLHKIVVGGYEFDLNEKLSRLIADGWIPYAASSVLKPIDATYPSHYVFLWRESKKIVTEPSNPCEESHVGDAGKPRNTPEY